MNYHFPIGRRLATALVAAVLTVNSAQAQPYPYWATAPQSYSGSQTTVPVPGIPPNLISNAARSPTFAPGLGMGLGGGYVPPHLTALDIASRLPQPQDAEANKKAHIWLRVPENCEVWMNGVKTKQRGETRYFYSPPLTPGKKYSYEMRIRWQKDGNAVEETQYLVVQAGAKIQRDFSHLDKTEKRP
jgi:uncharacterized protein (TIGR03000 family)